MLEILEESVTFVLERRNEADGNSTHITYDIRALDDSGTQVGFVESVPCTPEEAEAFRALCEEEGVDLCQAQDVLEDFAHSFYF